MVTNYLTEGLLGNNTSLLLEGYSYNIVDILEIIYLNKFILNTAYLNKILIEPTCL